MFTGVIERIGEAVGVRTSDAAVRLEVRAGDLLTDLRVGASVAVNGVCLTLVSRAGDVSGFDVVPETWRRSNLNTVRVGARLNLERALRVGDRLDGHFVQGHVDAVAHVDALNQTGGECKLWVRLTGDPLRYVIPKGSVTIDGVSLTVVNVEPERFSVALIPTTLRETTLGDRRAGDAVNIETDILARTIIGRLERLADDQPTAGVTWDHLREAGFLP